MSDPIIDAITTARFHLILGKPFFGSLATRLILVDASSWCSTAATDGKHLFYNREFIKTLNRPQLMFLLAHEVYHVLLDHIGRRGRRDKDVFNMAADYIINYSLTKEKVGLMPDKGLLDNAYTDEYTVDELYDLLIKNSVVIRPTLDEHIDVGADGDQAGKGDGPTVRVLGKDGPPVLSEADVEQIKNRFRAATIQTMQQYGADSVPAGVRRMIKALTEPQLDWRSMLDTHIRSTLRDDYTLQRISRRSWYMDAILPAQNLLDEVHIFCAVDASASTTPEMVQDFLSEVNGIVGSFRSYKIDILCFDADVYNHVTITPENADDIYTYEIKGGGGTLFSAVYSYMKRNGIEPHRLAFLTDGEPNNDDWGDPHYADTIFVIHSNPRKTAPYGVTCHYEPKSLRKAA